MDYTMASEVALACRTHSAPTNPRVLMRAVNVLLHNNELELARLPAERLADIEGTGSTFEDTEQYVYVRPQDNVHVEMYRLDPDRNPRISLYRWASLESYTTQAIESHAHALGTKIAQGILEREQAHVRKGT